MRRAPLSVLHFTITTVRGGVEEHILLLLRGLDRRYFRSTLVCPLELLEKLRPNLPVDVQAIPFNVVGQGQLATGYRFAQILRQQRIDILHSHMSQASRMASPIGRFCGIPVIVETPHVREFWRRGWFKGSFVVDRLVDKFIDRYIAVSEANAEYLRKEKRLPADKVCVVHNGANLARFDPSPPVPLEMRKTLGLSPDDRILMTIARLDPQKGHRVLIEAFSNLHRDFPRLKLICVGDGCLRQELESQVRALDLCNAVFFVGFQPNVEEWLALADVCVLASFYEGLPLIAIECLAAAKPLIATAVDGTPEIVINGQTGLTVPPADARSLTIAIARMLNDTELRSRVARAGRAWVLERFTPERQVRLTQELYLGARNRHRAAVADCATKLAAKPSV